MPELLAAFLYAQLENMDTLPSGVELCTSDTAIPCCPWRTRGHPSTRHTGRMCATNYHMFYILLESEPIRAALIEHLKAQGILAVFHYVSLHTSPMGRAMGYRKGMLPVTEDVSDRLLRLPMYFDLTDTQVDEVVAAIWSFFCGETAKAAWRHKTMSDRIPFNKPFIIGKELYYISQCVLQGHISGDGPYSKLCERTIGELLGAQHVLLTTSCTSALHIAALLCDIQPGDEVIMPAYCGAAAANVFLSVGARLVFVDVEDGHSQHRYGAR